METIAEFMTAAEFAELVRRPVQTLYQWRHRGIGPKGIRVGRGLLYRRTEVDAWLSQLEREQAGAVDR